MCLILGASFYYADMHFTRVIVSCVVPLIVVLNHAAGPNYLCWYAFSKFVASSPIFWLTLSLHQGHLPASGPLTIEPLHHNGRLCLP